MLKIPPERIIERLKFENPWWDTPHQIPRELDRFHRRAYLSLFFELLTTRDIRRAVVLMGPRRVGKTVMIHHAIKNLIEDGITPTSICYVSLDHPLYNGLRLEEILNHFAEIQRLNIRKRPAFIIFDEIQYLRNWENELKRLVDDYPRLKCIASGSAAAALRLKSNESGAGRFTEFLLPPLTFHEYLLLLNKMELIKERPALDEGDRVLLTAPNIEALNDSFVHYLNYGGYPEVIFSQEIQQNPQRFVKSDIIDKVLLRDLPSLYGIDDVNELNYLFTTLALNTSGEISIEELSKNSGVAKNTIKRYITYLEAAFLIKIVHRVDHTAKRFKRANFFKVYLTNPSIHSALFSPEESGDSLGRLAETAVYSQWFHSTSTLNYARWKDGEIDIVQMGRQKPRWVVEVKWSDRIVNHLEELDSLVKFCKHHALESARVTTKTIQAETQVDGVRIRFVPTALYCYRVGKNLIDWKQS